jgi:serine/threonine-protein kinase
VDPYIGRLIDQKYRIEKRLAAGGFGTVFLATHLHGEHELGKVVLKFLHSELAHDAAITKRFVTEAKAARELTSPHVVRVFDLGFSEEGIPFMVQEYIKGEGLDVAMKKAHGRLPFDRVVQIAMQIAEAMDEAHAKGILHRDLKPENLRLTPQRDREFVKVLDFGIARVDSGNSVATNSFIGTPRYMAPEQIKQKALDGRADIFALGVILFEMLTGEPPIPADSEMEYIHLNLIAAPRDIRSLRTDIPQVLADLVMRMMSKDKEERPSSMAEVYTELHAFAQLHPDVKVSSDDTGVKRVQQRAQFQPSITAKQEGVVQTPASLRPAATATGTPAIQPAVHTIAPAGMRSNRNLVIGGALGLVILAGVGIGLAIPKRTNQPAPLVSVPMTSPVTPSTGGGSAVQPPTWPSIIGTAPATREVAVPARPPTAAPGLDAVATTTPPSGGPTTLTPPGDTTTTTPPSGGPTTLTPPGDTTPTTPPPSNGQPQTTPTKRVVKKQPPADPFRRGKIGGRRGRGIQ